MVIGDIVKYTHDDGREYLGVVRGNLTEHLQMQYLPLCIMVNKVPEWNTAFIAKADRVEVLEAV